MLNLWQAAILLALDSTRVVNLRTGVLAGGGSDAWAETHLMMTEKVGAAIEACTALMTGDTLMSVIERYHGVVAANAHRLAS
jgi:hypothetical protein